MARKTLTPGEVRSARADLNRQIKDLTKTRKTHERGMLGADKQLTKLNAKLSALA